MFLAKKAVVINGAAVASPSDMRDARPSINYYQAFAWHWRRRGPRRIIIIGRRQSCSREEMILLE